MVYNDWGLYGFVQMLTYKCLRFGKELPVPRHTIINTFSYVLKGRKTQSWLNTKCK
jgi:transposase